MVGMNRRRQLALFAVVLIAVGVLARGAWYWREVRRDAEVVRWLRAHAMLLATVGPSGDLADLQPLGSAIGDARIVGVGEATHGTREHFLYKHRLLRYLVTQKGFRALAFESPWPTGLALNEYVLSGRGDPQRLLGRGVFGVWYTQEVLDMIRWMRAYNATVSPEQRVEFVGIDIQLTRVAAAAVVHYLEQVDGDFRARHGRTLDLLVAKEMEGLYLQYIGNERGRPRNTSETQAISAVVREIQARFDAQRARYIAASSADEFDLVRRHAKILVQQADVLRRISWGQRDRYMADNLDWFMARRPAVKVMVWAHNGHVETRRDTAGAALGRHLKDRHGPDYVSIGFVLGSGAYRASDARKIPVGHAPPSATFTLGRPPARTFNALMAATGYSIFAVDLRSARGGIRHLLERTFRLREGYGIVIVTGPGGDPLNTVKRVMPETHDILIFIDPTTAARRIASFVPAALHTSSRTGPPGMPNRCRS